MDNDNTILSAATCEACIQVVKNYQNAVDGLNKKVEGMLTSLAADSYIGDASDGYMEFYRNKVVPVVKDNLYGDESLTKGIINTLDNIKKVLLDETDPAMGKANREI